MPRRKAPSRKPAARKKSAQRESPERKPRVAKLPPEAEAARDEGPRLIPLPDVDAPVRHAAGEYGATNRYVALADRALQLWAKAAAASASDAAPGEPEAPGKSPESSPPHKHKR